MHIYPQKSCESYYLESFHAYLPNSLTDISETLLVWAAAHCEKEIAKKTTKSFMIEIIPPGLLRSAGTPRKYLHGCDDATVSVLWMMDTSLLSVRRCIDSRHVDLINPEWRVQGFFEASQHHIWHHLIVRSSSAHQHAQHLLSMSDHSTHQLISSSVLFSAQSLEP